MNQEERTSLVDGARIFGIQLTSAQTGQFSSYSEILEEWNKRINLTRVSRGDYVTLHFLDSLSVNAARPLSGSESVIDIGTGAGFPGIPLKIAFPRIRITLLDSTRKKLTFLEEVIRSLGLEGINTVHMRAEDAARLAEYRERFDVVTARAVSALPTLVEWLLPLVRLNGDTVALKSSTVDDELERAAPLIKRLGGAPARTVSISLPGTSIERKLVVILKRSRTSREFPRRRAIT